MPGIVEPEPARDPDAHSRSRSRSSSPAPELPVDDTPPRSYVVFRQSVELEIDFREKAVHGRSNLTIALTGDVSEVFIDARQCDIDPKEIRVSNCEVDASYTDPCDCLQTPDTYQWSAPQWALRQQRMRPLQHHKREEVSALDHDLKCCTPVDGSLRVRLPTGMDIQLKNQGVPKTDRNDYIINDDDTISTCTVSVPFRLKNTADGFHFVGVDEADPRYPHVYTRHSVEPGTACSIFPCIDDPGSRNSWKISITCPRTIGDAFQQALATQQQFKGPDVANGNRKRKHGNEEPARCRYPLTEEDKLLEMTVICSGFLTNEVTTANETKKTMTFEIDKNKAAKHVGFAVGPFEHVDLWSEFRTEEDDVKLGISAAKVHGYCLPGRAEEVRNTCAALVTAVDYFVLTFGRYPFESYKVCFVDDMIEDTVSLCAFSLCNSKLLYPREIIDYEVDTTRILVHALASQWFGVNVVPNLKSDIWLIVGIAWFMTDQFIKFLCGNNEFRFRMKERADRLVQIDHGRPSLHDLGEHLYLGDFETEFMNLKAPLVLFILDRRLSKSSNSAGLTRIISKMVGKANTTVQASDEVLISELFRKACEKTGGSRLDSFWNQWIKGSGCPLFVVYQRFNKKRLCVEMTVRQVQDQEAAKKKPLLKDDFWREVREEKNAVDAGELHHCFTGPMTIRIHEADGTPYEHIVDIREDQAKSAKFEIPYNTKYKRLKRNRRQRERQIAGAAKNNEDGQEEAQIHFLGDVLQQQEDMDQWNLREWDDETEAKMDQESYEWIRMDADFEWVCDMKTNLQPYMYVSQLQQDRDVVAQQDSMLYLEKSFNRTGPHPLVSTILTRTVVDKTYFYGIRMMAVDVLPQHAAEDLEWIGLVHLRKTFQHFFCHPGTFTPRPNNFSDKRQYFVQKAIPEAVARIRGFDGNCPKDARYLILEQLQENNNADNVYSDQLYICKLIRALALCQVHDAKKAKDNMGKLLALRNTDEEDEDAEVPVDTEPQEFRDMSLEEIERYRRMDEYSSSYHNCYTVAALDALCILMKEKVIPVKHITFVQYLQDRTADIVRIKACESLIELGTLKSATFLRYFISLVSTDPSPFVRDRLFKALCRGLAGMAFGEDAKEEEPEQEQPADDRLIVEQDNTDTEAAKKKRARKEDLTAALAALKDELRDDEQFAYAVWDAIESPVLTVAERLNLLELCSILIDQEYSLPLTFRYPTYWTVSKGEWSRNKAVLNFNRHFRTKSRKKYETPLPPAPKAPKVEHKRTITLNLNRAPSFSGGKPSTPGGTPQPTPQPVATPKSTTSKTSAAVTAPKISAIKTPATNAAPRARASSVSSKSSVGAARPSPAKPREGTPKISTGNSASHATGLGDSISVQTPRPTIEALRPEPKGSSTPKTNGASTPAGPSNKSTKSLKRASAEIDGGASSASRPTKIVKLNTSKIPANVLERLSQTPPAPKLKPKSKPKKVVTLKFNSWDKLKRRPSPAASGSIRAAPAKPKLVEQRSGSVGVHGNNSSSNKNAAKGARSPSISVATTKTSNKTPSSAASPAPGLAKRSSTPLSSTPKSSQQPVSSSQPQSSATTKDGKPRKPLPDPGRKPLPDPGGGGGGSGRKSLPDTRKPLPSGTHQNSHTSGATNTPNTSNSNHSKTNNNNASKNHNHRRASSSHSPSRSRERDRDRDRDRDRGREPSSSAAPPPPKAPTKLKIKIKNPSSQQQ